MRLVLKFNSIPVADSSMSALLFAMHLLWAGNFKLKIMSVSIMEALQNANYNLDNVARMPMLLPMVKEQLNNAVTLLDKGYSIWDEVEPLLEEFGSVENVPEKQEA